MARSRGANSAVNFAFESIYGTPPAPGSYQQMPFSSFNLGEEQGYIASDLLGQGREPLDPSRDVINNDGDITVPVDLRYFGYWLKALLGTPVDTNVASVYTHTFASGAAAVPSLTLESEYPEVPSFGQNFGVRVNTMRIQLQRSGLLTAQIGLIAQGETLLTTSASGTPTLLVVKRFSQFQGNIMVDGAVAGLIDSAEFTYSNNLDKVDTIRADGRITDADPAMVSVTGSITSRFADTVMLNKATTGAPTTLSFGWSNSSSESLLFGIPRIFLPKVRRPITGPAGIRATFPFQAARDTTSQHAMSAVLVNDVVSYV